MPLPGTHRIVIAGGPLVGKTTLADSLAGEAALHTDSLRGLGWSEASEAASRWFDAPGPWVVEGVAAFRALRKWLRRNPTGAPCDALYILTLPHAELSKGQAAMTKGCATVLAEIQDELAARDVEIHFLGRPTPATPLGYELRHEGAL